MKRVFAAAALAVVCVVLLAGCVPMDTKADLNTMTPAQVQTWAQSKTHAKGTSFGDQDVWFGPSMTQSIKTDGHAFLSALAGMSDGGGVASFYLAADTHHDGRPPSVSLVASVGYSANDWHFYESAALPSGEVLPFHSIDREVNDCISPGCDYTESFSATLAPAVLSTHMHGHDLIVRFTGRDNKSITFDVPDGYIAGFLAAVPSVGSPAVATSVR